MKTTKDEVDKVFNIVRYIVPVIMTGIFCGFILYYGAEKRKAMRELHEKRIQYEGLVSELRQERREVKNKLRELERREKALEKREAAIHAGEYVRDPVTQKVWDRANSMEDGDLRDELIEKLSEIESFMASNDEAEIERILRHMLEKNIEQNTPSDRDYIGMLDESELDEMEKWTDFYRLFFTGGIDRIEPRTDAHRRAIQSVFGDVDLMNRITDFAEKKAAKHLVVMMRHPVPLHDAD